jgi:CBS domain-containing protein
MKVHEAMTRDVQVADPDQTLRQAARLMAAYDIGALPVGRDNRLVGMLTDRDIAVRAVAEGRGPETKIGEVMSQEVMYCFEDEELDHVVDNMGSIQVRRLPVVDRDKRLVGIVSIGDIAASEDLRKIGEALACISVPGGAHSQTAGTH